MFSIANFDLLETHSKPMWDLSPSRVIGYFEARAPDRLDTPPWQPGASEPGLRFQRQTIHGRGFGGRPEGIANLRLLHVFEDLPYPQLVVCDMFSGRVSWMDPRSPERGLQTIAVLSNPAHAAAVDLDRDGRMDLLIADLGSPVPTDDLVGSIIWLRRVGDREFEVIPLATRLGRVADVQAADFDGDGDIDIVAAVFGWRRVGEILYLENLSSPDSEGLPRFQPSTLDNRAGAIHVPIVDLNGNGKPDFVALFAQEHQAVSAFLNRGNGEFEVKEIHSGEHPSLGATGIQVVDLDGDGDLDVLLTHGDTMDDGIPFKPYHGVSWLENRGTFPFVHHHIGTYYGVHRAQAVDLDGDGDLDIVASSFLHGLHEETRREMNLPGLIWYEQTSPGVFQPRVLADVPCEYPTLDVGDLDGDGIPDVVTGNMRLPFPAPGTERPLIEFWFTRR